MTADEKTKAANQKKTRTCINLLNSKIKDCKHVVLQLKGSKHCVAKAVSAGLKDKEKQLSDSLHAVQKADVEGIYKGSAMKLVSHAEEIIKRVVVEIKLGKSISK